MDVVYDMQVFIRNLSVGRKLDSNKKRMLQIELFTSIYHCIFKWGSQNFLAYMFHKIC